MMRRLLPLPGLLILVNLLSAQVDSTSSDTTAIPITFSLRGGFYYQPQAGSNDPGPDYFDIDQEFQQRIDKHYPWRDTEYLRTDNPLYHGAGYVRLDAVAEPIPEARLQAGIIGEMRGMSYGVRDTRNMIVYPEFLFSFGHDLPILGDTLHAYFAVGDRPQYKSLMPLTFYNTDIQGSEWRIGYRWLELEYEKAAGDAVFGIGLNIGDADHWAVRTRGVQVFDSTDIVLQVGGYSYPSIYYLSTSYFYYISSEPEFANDSPRARLFREVELGNSGYAALGSIGRDINPNLHGEMTLNYAIRDGEDLIDHLMSRSAFLARLNLEGKWYDGEFMVEGAYRYYGGFFNAGFRNDNPSYREEPGEEDDRYDEDDNIFRATYANSIGPYLYPLSNLDYPFSRWAVFTEYQDLKDVTGWTLYARGRWRFADRFFAGGMLDLNLIVPEKSESEIYPFFAVGVGYEPYPSITLSLDVTNRTMNLDKHYPTFYRLDGMAAQGTIRWKTGW